MAQMINAIEAVEFITMCFRTKLVPFLAGSPGLGKSAIYQQIADKYKLKLIDIRLSQCDPTDISGFPMLKGDKAGYAPMDLFPLIGEDLPDGYNGWLILFDEINQANQAVQAASYKAILDRMIGQYQLHDKVAMGCAGNLATDGAIVNRIGTAMQSRLIHLELGVDHKAWSLWASANHLATEIISYINHRPDHLHKFDPNHNDKTFACPRTWEFASRLVQFNRNKPLREKLPVLAGTVSEGIAHEFIMYCDVYQHIPTYKDIIADPTGIDVTNEPSMLAALAGTVGSNLTDRDIPAAMKYIKRLPIEFQVFSLRDAIKRTPSLIQSEEISDWLDVNTEALA